MYQEIEDVTITLHQIPINIPFNLINPERKEHSLSDLIRNFNTEMRNTGRSPLDKTKTLTVEVDFSEENEVLNVVDIDPTMENIIAVPPPTDREIKADTIFQLRIAYIKTHKRSARLPDQDQDLPFAICELIGLQSHKTLKRVINKYVEDWDRQFAALLNAPLILRDMQNFNTPLLEIRPRDLYAQALCRDLARDNLELLDRNIWSNPSPNVVSLMEKNIECVEYMDKHIFNYENACYQNGVEWTFFDY